MIDIRNQSGVETELDQNVEINSKHKPVTFYQQEHAHSQGGRLALNQEVSQGTHLLQHRPPQKRTFSTRAHPGLEERGNIIVSTDGIKK